MAEEALRRPPQLSSVDWLKTLPPAARWVLHGDAQARARAAPVWGVGFAETACRAVRRAERATLWLGPDEYLLLDLAAQDVRGRATATATAITEAAIEDALRDTPHALVDVSHRQFALEVSGPHAEIILRGACPLDLHIGQFPVGMCTRTLLAKADITLWRTRDDAFHIEVWRSFAGYVGGLLREIAREFQPG
jgi:sarcosine oxidase, subunit gamma